MSNTTNPVQITEEDGQFHVRCSQHGRHEVFPSKSAAERYSRGHEAAVSHWYPEAPTLTPVQQAEELGMTAYNLPVAHRAPVLDTELVAMIENLPVGSGAAPIMQAWLAGWDWAADLAAHRALEG